MDNAEELLFNIPEMNVFGDEEKFPLGWFWNYQGGFSDLNAEKMEMKKSKFKKSV